MKNITLSIDEEVLAAARRYAAEHESTVNGLVREFLTDIARRADRAKKVRKRLRRLSDASNARLGTKTWSRDELHGR